MHTASSAHAARPSTSSTYESAPETDGHVDLLAALDPDKAGKAWHYASIIEPHPSGEPIRHGRVSCIDRPTEQTIRAMLPCDGEMHMLLIDFRNAEGHPVARPALTFWADAAPEPPTQFEMAQAQPTFQVMDMVRETNTLNLKLVGHLMEDAKLAREQAAEMRRAELGMLRDMHEKTAETLAKVEGARAVDPMAEVARMAMPMAKGVGLWALAKASGFVDEAGGLKDAVGAVAGAVAGGGDSGPSAVEVIGPLIDKGIMLVMNRMNVQAQKAKAEASVRKAEAEAQAAAAEASAAEAAYRAAEAAARVKTGGDGGTINVTAVG